MANLENLLPGDAVRWLRKNEIVAATVWGKTPTKVAIFFEHNGERVVRYVMPRELQLVYGGKKRLAREMAKRPALRAQPTPLADPPRDLMI